MSKEVDIEEIDNHSQKQENIIHLSGMYENWFWIILLCYFRTFCSLYSRWIKSQYREGFYIH